MPAADQALLLVDVQNDFCPGGSLAVDGGDTIIPVLNEYVSRFRARGLPVLLSRDWHPVQTTHFEPWGGPWPPHCVQNTRGADFHPTLHIPPDAIVVSKGAEPDRDAYSAFQAVDPTGSSLADSLRARGVTTLFVGGLATDYCVRSSVLDARREGFDVVLLADAMRGIDLEPGDVARAIDEMTKTGVTATTLASLDRYFTTPT